MPRMGLAGKRTLAREMLIHAVNKGMTPKQISETLLGKGVKKNPKQVAATIWQLRQKGLISNFESTAGKIRETLANNQNLTNAEVAAKVNFGKTKKIDSKYVWGRRKHAKIGYTPRATMMARMKQYPVLSAYELKVLEASMKPLHGVASGIARANGIENIDTIEDFYSFCLEQLPRWTPKISKGLKEDIMGRQLVARLRLRARLAIKKFFVKETMQRTAMTRNEVNHGINLQKLLKNGRSVEGAAAEEGINVKDAEEILAALAIKTARLKRVF